MPDIQEMVLNILVYQVQVSHRVRPFFDRMHTFMFPHLTTLFLKSFDRNVLENVLLPV